MEQEKFRKTKSGTIFKPETGTLYDFCYDRIKVMRGWPEPLAWRKTRKKPIWICCRPQISKTPVNDLDGRIRQLENPYQERCQTLLPFFDPPDVPRSNRAQLAWFKWFNTIPRDVRRLMAPFSSRQWHMLSFLARCGPAAADLTESNPALAFALASNWVYHKPPVQRPLRSVRALLNKKQRHILTWLGFPGTEAARRVFAKIPPPSVNISGLFYVGEAIKDPQVAKTLSHLQRLNAGAIRIATDPEFLSFASFNLLEEVAHRRNEDRRPRAAYLLRDSLNMHRLLFPGDKKFRPVRSLSRLAELHDSLIEDLNRAHVNNTGVPFPPPPVEGTEQIVPITTERELVEEGRIQHNCVASYADQVAVQQRVYIYRVLTPQEHCTLAIRRRQNTWTVSELMRTCNETPSPETHRIVRSWMAGAIAG